MNDDRDHIFLYKSDEQDMTAIFKISSDSILVFLPVFFFFKYKVYYYKEIRCMQMKVYGRKEIFDSWLISAFIPMRHLKV